MALINCSECGKEVSDKAASCPNCGNPINNNPIKKDVVVNTTSTTNEDLLKCPKCSSTQLTSNKKGFSGGKAVAGAVLTGGIGLLAGTIGSGNVEITCLKCGTKFKAGEYYKEKKKYDEERAFYQRSAKGQESFVGITIVFLIFSIIGFIISYKLFSNDWNLLGTVFTLATIACVGMTIFGIYSESTRTPKE